MKFTEAQLEQAFINLLQEEKMTHLVGGEVRKIEYNGAAEPPTVYGHVVSEQVLLTEDLKNYLRSAYTGKTSQIDHPIPVQIDHQFRSKLTTTFQFKLTT